MIVKGQPGSPPMDLVLHINTFSEQRALAHPFGFAPETCQLRDHCSLPLSNCLFSNIIKYQKVCIDIYCVITTVSILSFV